MKCPACHSAKTRTLDSRVNALGLRVRRRLCDDCESRWSTDEIIVAGTLRKARKQPTWWKDARDLDKAGVSQIEIAARLGFSVRAVVNAIRPTARILKVKRQRLERKDPEVVAVERFKRITRQQQAEARP